MAERIDRPALDLKRTTTEPALRITATEGATGPSLVVEGGIEDADGNPIGGGSTTDAAFDGDSFEVEVTGSIDLYSFDNGNVVITADGGNVNLFGAGGTFRDTSGDGIDIESNAGGQLRLQTDGSIGIGSFNSGQGVDVSIATGTGSTLGFYGATPVAKQTGVAVTAAAVHAALVALGLIGV